ncbi:MAG: hypothetical protein RIQ33_1527 [Bacteroidota bacterium]|jgi:hypothetical protein
MQYCKNILLIIIVSFCIVNLSYAQELYPSSEPASNMSSKSIGVRLGTQWSGNRSNTNLFRINPELMWGINKKWMMHIDEFMGNVYQNKFDIEQFSIYTKYRFLSIDDVHSHFRMAMFGRITTGNNSLMNDSMMINYMSGYTSGIVLTQLIHKVAVSSALSYYENWNSTGASFNYIFSAGYLLFPRHYSKYKQLNINLYAELLGKKMTGNKNNFVDIAPALQFIISSIARIDLVYQTKISKSSARNYNSLVLLKLEYNFLNAYK